MNNIEIVLGKKAGFCLGVKRAVDGALESLKTKDSNICCLGEIVHNKEVVKDLQDKGMKFIEDIKAAKDNTLIRAHGVPKEIYEYAKANNINLVDFTCTKVLSIHKIAQEYSNKGFNIILLGNKKHPENIGTISYCGKNSYVIETMEELTDLLDKLISLKVKKILVIAQTTFNLKKFFEMEKYIKKRIGSDIDLVIKNTICKATEQRQQETEDISKNVDFMIIIGGSNSSNTKKLYEIARENCKTICIENADKLNINDLKGIKKVGIMAGASTPKKSIDEVINKIQFNIN